MLPGRAAVLGGRRKRAARGNDRAACGPRSRQQSRLDRSRRWGRRRSGQRRACGEASRPAWRGLLGASRTERSRAVSDMPTRAVKPRCREPDPGRKTPVAFRPDCGTEGQIQGLGALPGAPWRSRQGGPRRDTVAGSDGAQGVGPRAFYGAGAPRGQAPRRARAPAGCGPSRAGTRQKPGRREPRRRKPGAPSAGGATGSARPDDRNAAGGSGLPPTAPCLGTGLRTADPWTERLRRGAPAQGSASLHLGSVQTAVHGSPLPHLAPRDVYVERRSAGCETRGDGQVSRS